MQHVNTLSKESAALLFLKQIALEMRLAHPIWIGRRRPSAHSAGHHVAHGYHVKHGTFFRIGTKPDNTRQGKRMRMAVLREAKQKALAAA